MNTRTLAVSMAALLLFVGAGCASAPAEEMTETATTATEAASANVEAVTPTLTAYYDAIANSDLDAAVALLNHRAVEATPEGQWRSIWTDMINTTGGYESHEILNVAEPFVSDGANIYTVTVNVFYADTYQQELIDIIDDDGTFTVGAFAAQPLPDPRLPQTSGSLQTLAGYYTALQAQDTDTYISLLDERTFENTPQEQWLALWDTIATESGQLLSYQLDNLTGEETNLGVIMTAEVTATYENDQGAETLTLFFENETQATTITHINSVPQ